jgi:hypothetical protein
MERRWFAIAVATLVWALALWFGFLAISTGRTVALITMGVGLVFSLYALAWFSGDPDLATSGFRSSLGALGTAIALVIAFSITDADAFIVAAPVAAFGVGAASALHPVPDGVGSAARIVAVVLMSGLLVWIHGIDHTVYGLLAPLVVLPAITIADHLVVRAREVVGEPTPD